MKSTAKKTENSLKWLFVKMLDNFLLYLSLKEINLHSVEAINNQLNIKEHSGTQCRSRFMARERPLKMQPKGQKSGHNYVRKIYRVQYP